MSSRAAGSRASPTSSSRWKRRGSRCWTSRTCGATTRSRSTPGASASTATGSASARSTRAASTSASGASGASTSTAAQRCSARLNVHEFAHVLHIGEGFGDAEGMVTYEDLARACLARGVMPAVVPQLKTITLGGAVAGVGIESSSHRYGLVHDTMLELDVLLA